MKTDIYKKQNRFMFIKSGEKPIELFKDYAIFKQSYELVNGKSAIGLSKENVEKALIEIEENGYYLTSAGIEITENIT